MLNINKDTVVIDTIIIDTTKYQQKYNYSTAKIIKNNYDKEFNFLTIDKGKLQGIQKEIAVINSKGIIGIIDK